MKSIVIIIALFLVTLTAKADWVTKNSLEQIQLPESNFFFTKVNDSCTKMLLVSQKNLKLYIVDLATGKTEREQKIPQSFSLCDYDFELESFVFLYSNNSPEPQVLYKLKRNDSLEIFANSGITRDATYLFGKIYLINILNHDLHISIDRTYTIGHGELRNDKVYKTYLNLDTKKAYDPKVSITTSILFQDGLFIINDANGYIGNNSGVFNILNTKEIFVWSDKFKVLDILGNYLSCKVDDNKIRYVEVNSGKTLNISTLDSNKNTFSQMTNYKLINSIAEAVFFKSSDTMYVLDNYKGKVTNTIPFVNGKLYFKKSNNIIYSLKDSNIFRTTIAPNAKPNDEIIVSQSYYLLGHTIQLTKPDIYFYKEYTWEVNGVKYLDVQPSFQIKNAGSYDVKFNYVENGITKTILKEKAILVVDSLKVNYSINGGKELLANTDILFTASSNYPNATYYWENTHCYSFWNVVRMVYSPYKVTSNSNSFSDVFNRVGDGLVSTNVNSSKLIVTNGYQKLEFNNNLNITRNLTVKLDKYSGFVPLTVKINAIVSCNACNEGSDATNGLLDLGAVRIPITNRLDNYNYTFTKPGKYKIKLLCGYNGVYSRTHDSVIIVRDTTIFQAFPTKFRNSFASNKYAMTQDADGYYLEFDKEEADIQLFDSMGRLIKSYHIKDEEYIRKEDLERGVYFLQINVNGELFHEKVLIN